MSTDAELSDLIGAIYDCVIDPSRWRDVVERIRRRYSFYNGILGVNGTLANDLILNVAVNIPDAMLPVIDEYGADVMVLWGGWSRISAVPLEEPLMQSEVRPPTWTDTGYYRHFIAPQGIIDSVAIALVRDQHTVANISFGLDGATPPLTDAVLDELRLLAPHLRRAVVIGRLLEASMAAAASFADALDAAASGIVLVDRRRRVVHANRAATAMLAAGDPVRTVGGLLELSTEIVPGALRRAIETAGEAAGGSLGTGVPARRLDGEPLTVQVMPLERQSGAQTPLPAAAAVFISEAAGGPATSAEILAVLFDLTPAESRIFALIVAGKAIGEIAAQLSIAPATAKTHLARVYHKTGQTSRAGLVRLAQEIAPPP